MDSVKITGLYIHPLKSAQPISLESMDIVATGPKWDREWMLVDQENQFISQRTHPRLCLLGQQIIGDKLVFQGANMSNLELDMGDQGQLAKSALLFNNEVKGRHLNPIFDKWFSEFLGCSVELIRCSADLPRYASEKYAPAKTLVSFSDGFPFLLTSESSLARLNKKILGSPVQMGRFRPNIVVSGAPADEEDDWPTFKIGKIEFQGIKNCSRCEIVNIDPSTSQSSPEVIPNSKRIPPKG